jgi:hypothetical protein
MIEKRFTVREDTFWQKLVLPEEDRKRLLGVEWRGGYRWFRSANIVPIEHYRRPELTPQQKAS